MGLFCRLVSRRERFREPNEDEGLAAKHQAVSNGLGCEHVRLNSLFFFFLFFFAPRSDLEFAPACPPMLISISDSSTFHHVRGGAPRPVPVSGRRSTFPLSNITYILLPGICLRFHIDTTSPYHTFRPRLGHPFWKYYSRSPKCRYWVFHRGLHVLAPPLL